MSRLDRARARNLAKRRTSTPRTIGTDPALRTLTPFYGTGFTGTRRHGNKRGSDTKGQWRDSTGGTAGAWNRSPYTPSGGWR